MKDADLIPTAHANTAFGVILFVWIIIPALHYSGVWYSDYLPILQNSILDNTGAVYNTSRILTPEHVVDPAAYEAYSPLFLSTSFALSYGMNFASIAALISQTYLFHGAEIWRRWKSSRGELDDVHMKIMRKYKLVPTWWYLILLAVMIVFAFVSALSFPTEMAWYSVILSLVIAGTWTIPIGIIQAFTNIQLGLNVFTEFIIGYVQPGHPIAMMMFKTFGYIVMTQALYFCQDLKLGHYMHVPQRSLFAAQLVATVWSCLCQLATVQWAMGAIKNVCTSKAAGFFTCAYVKTFYNASVIWGAIGPKHLFSGDAVYKNLQYFWLVGFAAPIFVYGAARMFPRVSWVRKASMPLIFGALGYVPPYSSMNIVSPTSPHPVPIVRTRSITNSPAARLVPLRLRLQQVHPHTLPRLVDAVQLHHLGRPRRRARALRYHPVLLRSAARRHDAGVLGHDHHRAHHGRRRNSGAQGSCRRRDVWTQGVEVVDVGMPGCKRRSLPASMHGTVR